MKCDNCHIMAYNRRRARYKKHINKVRNRSEKNNVKRLAMIHFIKWQIEASTTLGRFYSRLVFIIHNANVMFRAEHRRWKKVWKNRIYDIFSVCFLFLHHSFCFPRHWTLLDTLVAATLFENPCVILFKIVQRPHGEIFTLLFNE